jgi:hypothetical protein
MRVARITRIMTWKLYMGVSLRIVSKEDVEVHTHTTRCGRRTGVQNINGSIIESIYKIHAPEGAAM